MTETKRGCGYRRWGQMYMAGSVVTPLGPCGKLPHPLTICAGCGHGYKQTRAFQRVDPAIVFADATCAKRNGTGCLGCPLSDNNLKTAVKAGLIWIGEQFYPTPAHFIAEATAMGVSRRIKAVPRWFRLGSDGILLAHPKVTVQARVPMPSSSAPPKVGDRVRVLHVNFEDPAPKRYIGRDGVVTGYEPDDTSNGHHPYSVLVDGDDMGDYWYTAESLLNLSATHATTSTTTGPGIFAMFKPDRIEVIVPDTRKDDAVFLKTLTDRGLTPVFVDATNPDHWPSKNSKHYKYDTSGGKPLSLSIHMPAPTGATP